MSHDDVNDGQISSDDQECLVNFSKSGRLVFTYVVQSDNQCRFRASMISGQFRDKSGRFFFFRRQRVFHRSSVSC